MSDDNLFFFTPHGSKTNWEQQANEIVSINQNILIDHLHDLLTWLQDMNWPGSNTISKYLQTLGEPLVPYIKEVLNSSDTEWIFFVFEEIINNWSTELIIQIKNDLLKISRKIDLGGNFLSAFSLLNKHHLLSKEEYGVLKDELLFRLTEAKNTYVNFLNDLSEL